MVGLALCVLAIVATYAATQRSLGAGLQALIAVGYFYGVGRGRSPDTFTHFPFDCALVTLYAVHFTRRLPPEIHSRAETARSWAKLFVIWPCVCLTYGMLLESSQPFGVQLVGLRAAIVMVPCLILGAQMTRDDLDRVAIAFAVMNVIALSFGLAEYFFGVEAVMPRTITTEDTIYLAHDVEAGGHFYLRIPSMFISSHVYGGVMALSTPFLIHGLELGRRGRLLCIAGLGAAIVGTFLCGARTPVVILGIATLYMLITMRMRSSTLLAVALVGLAAFYLVTHNERFQRYQTLGDSDYVSTRIAGSVNMSIFDIIGEYPLGAGLARAAGTNIPYFLNTDAKPPIGIESEYGHIAVEQGIPGLLLLVAFVLRVVTRRNAPMSMSGAASALGAALVAALWADGLLGTGLMSAIPQTAFFLLLTGMRLADPPPKAVELSVRHVGRPVRPVARAPALARVSRPA